MDALLNRLYVVRLALYIMADKLIGVHVHIHTHTHKLIYAYKKKMPKLVCPLLLYQDPMPYPKAETKMGKPLRRREGRNPPNISA